MKKNTDWGGEAPLPKHVAVIMDGNGRWAKQRLLPRSMGHRAGCDTFVKIAKCAKRLGISCITFYVFSTENWKRSEEEKSGLFDLFNEFFDKGITAFYDDRVNINFFGDTSAFPADVREKIAKLQSDERKPGAMECNLAMNYGSRAELVRAAKLLCRDVGAGYVQSDAIDEQTFGKYLYSGGQPDVDLLIRTGGDSRISNFLLWQISYAELFFVKKFWPDFTERDFIKILSRYQKRERRFGKA